MKKNKLARIIIALWIFLTVLMVILAVSKADDSLTEAWVMCQPGDFVNVRLKPSRKSQSVGYADCGDSVMTDGRKKNGFIKVYGIGEFGEGWIHQGYVSWQEPVKVNGFAIVVSRGRLAARRCIDGKRRCWLKNTQKVKVYWITDSWCVTDKGFVKTKYLEMEGT